MVDLNFTLVVQLLMFLGFLWAMNRWVLRPLLQFMDEREQTMAQAREQAETDQQTAETLEQEYAAALAAIHRKAHQKVMEAVRVAQNHNLEDRESVKQRHSAEVAEVRREAHDFVEQERNAYPQLSQDIAENMMARLGLGGNAS